MGQLGILLLGIIKLSCYFDLQNAIPIISYQDFMFTLSGIVFSSKPSADEFKNMDLQDVLPPFEGKTVTQEHGRPFRGLQLGLGYPIILF